MGCKGKLAKSQASYLSNLPGQGHRPFAGLSSQALLAQVQLAVRERNAYSAMLCAEEASHRRQTVLKAVLANYKEIDFPPATIMAKAVEAASPLKRAVAGEHHVYVALLLKAGPKAKWGVYVGETSKPIRKRFEQHRSGAKNLAATSMKKQRICLLPALYEHLNPIDKAEAKVVEGLLADALKECGLWVEGGH